MEGYEISNIYALQAASLDVVQVLKYYLQFAPDDQQPSDLVDKIANDSFVLALKVGKSNLIELSMAIHILINCHIISITGGLNFVSGVMHFLAPAIDNFHIHNGEKQ